jgi:hypothetical protein
MNNLDIAEAAIGGPFTVRILGSERELPDPVDMPFISVLEHLQAGVAPGIGDAALTLRATQQIFRRWSAHHDLPDFQSAQRLTYLVDHYRSALVYDLRERLGVDLGELWRARRWRTLLDYIDHLPSHSWYSVAVANDEEHAKMIAESLAEREREGEKQPTGPDMHTWTPEVAAITRLTDAVNRLHYIIPAAQGDKKVKPPEPLPRPITALETALKRAEEQRRKRKHESLVARVLPHKR